MPARFCLTVVGLSGSTKTLRKDFSTDHFASFTFLQRVFVDFDFFWPAKRRLALLQMFFFITKFVDFVELIGCIPPQVYAEEDIQKLSFPQPKTN